MSTAALAPEALASTESYTEKNGVYWYTGAEMNVRDLTKAMNALQARFVTITAYELPKSEGFRLEYHWDLVGRLLGFPLNLTGKEIESIYDLSEAVDWIEREVHEEYGIVFTGRVFEPLLLRENDTGGVNMREMPCATVVEEVAK